MEDSTFVEPVGPIGLTGSEALSLLGGSTERVASFLEWEREASRRQSLVMPRKQQREVLDMIMSKVTAREYKLLNYHPDSGFLVDSFEISIRNKDGYLWRIHMFEYCLRVMPENNLKILCFSSLEPRIIGVCFPHSRRLIRIIDYLRNQNN